jgi:hypothetical protein
MVIVKFLLLFCLLFPSQQESPPDKSGSDWIFRGMPITHSEVKPIICSEANRSSIPRHADQWFRGQADQEFRAVGMI